MSGNPKDDLNLTPLSPPTPNPSDRAIVNQRREQANAEDSSQLVSESSPTKIDEGPDT